MQGHCWLVYMYNMPKLLCVLLPFHDSLNNLQQKLSLASPEGIRYFLI